MADITAAYDLYYEQGTYDQRYPRPNPRTLEAIVALQPDQPTDVLDIGCGNGRYAIPLAQQGIGVLCCDPSPVAMEQLHDRASALGVTSKITTVDVAVDAVPDAGTVLMAFGVLSHIGSLDDQRSFLAPLVKASSVQTPFVVTVPNANRRFLPHQVRSAASRQPRQLITYRRTIAQTSIDLPYYLHTISSLSSLFESVGLEISTVFTESTFSERTALSDRWGAADRRIGTFVPSSLAYGFGVVARKQDHI